MNTLISVQIIPSRNIIMAIALMVCITLRLKFVGLFGSFFLKKYINKYRKGYAESKRWLRLEVRG
jgi:hypothetical protein